MAMAAPVMAVMAVASAAMSAYGMIKQGEASASAASQANAAAMYNAQVEEGNARRARDVAKVEADDMRLLGERDQGKLRAKVGALGLIAEEGSPYELLLDNAATIELDAQRRIYKGEVEAQSHLSQAQLDRMRMQSTDTTGAYLSAGGTLLGAGAKAYTLLGGGGGRSSVTGDPRPRGGGSGWTY